MFSTKRQVYMYLTTAVYIHYTSIDSFFRVEGKCRLFMTGALKAWHIKNSMTRELTPFKQIQSGEAKKSR